MTQDQFAQLMAFMRENNAPPPQVNNADPLPNVAPRNDPSALGPMAPCPLGKNKMTKLTKFEEWLEEAENRMDYIGNQEDKDKIILLKSWGGSELNDFLKTHVSINTTQRAADGDQPAVNPDTYDQVIEKIKSELRKLVNRTMAMHDLYSTKQGSKSWMDYIHDLEKKAKVLDFARRPYTTDEAVKDAAIRGMSDIKLSEKALAEDLDKDTLVKQGQAREAGRQDVDNLRQKDTPVVRRVSCRQDIEEMTDGELDEVLEAIKIMRLQKAGRYSGRYPKDTKETGDDSSCTRCLTKHPKNRCPAWNSICDHCRGKGHFEIACKKKKKPQDVRRITEESYLSTRSSYCPDVVETKTTTTIRKMNDDPSTSLEVPIAVGGEEPMSMFIDSGVKYTVIPPEKYDKSMGEIVEPDTNFRAWGSDELLNTKGMIHTVITTKRGATKVTKVYLVEGFNAEPLLGCLDAEDLGFITICREGRAPTENETTGCIIKKVNLEEEREDEKEEASQDVPERKESGSITQTRPKSKDSTTKTAKQEKVQEVKKVEQKKGQRMKNVKQVQNKEKKHAKQEKEKEIKNTDRGKWRNQE